MSKKIPNQDLRKARILADPTCSKCGESKTSNDFRWDKHAVDYWCVDCHRAYAADLYRKKIASLRKKELSKFRSSVNRRQNKRRAARLKTMSPKDLAAFRDKVNRSTLKSRNDARDAVYNAYGGYVCACCRETERAFLSLDHVNNDGSTHRRANNLKTGYQMHVWLIRNGFPKGFQVLCMNCNWGKRMNNGACPHQVRCRDHPARE